MHSFRFPLPLHVQVLGQLLGLSTVCHIDGLMVLIYGGSHRAIGTLSEFVLWCS
jgi:hypothetical protein